MVKARQPTEAPSRTAKTREASLLVLATKADLSTAEVTTSMQIPRIPSRWARSPRRIEG